MPSSPSPLLVGVSLKLYFGHSRALRWCEQVAAIAARNTAVSDGRIEVFVMPSFPSLESALRVLRGGAVGVGAQDLFWRDEGAYTGEVSGAVLAELGCRYVEVGHAERRSLFGETDEIVAEKTAAALRNGLIPVLCVGEASRCDPVEAAAECRAQIEFALRGSTAPVVVAWEPRWAIGAESPAEPEYIRAVCAVISETLGEGQRLIYGGSAGPGLFPQLKGAVDGLFLGRFAHDPAALAAVIDEVAA